MSAIMRAYCPTGTNPEAIVNLMIGHGGYTTTSGMGHWVGPDHKIISEQVVIYECVVPDIKARMQLEHAGRAFLNDNRKEQAFLGVVIGQRVEQVYINQE